LIASTPKTGNTWLRYLMAVIYDLPMVELDTVFDRNQIAKLGPRWISQQHYYPQSELLEWASEQNAVILTTIRHPCDTLISLYHYVQNYINDRRGQGFGNESAMVRDDGKFGDQTKLFIEGPFCGLLNISVSWIYSRCSHVVRYEDLWRDPVRTLVDLTSRIYPVSPDLIARAVEQCDIGVMRRLDESNSKFFRQGSIGGWRKSLPAEILDLFRDAEPYPDQFAALGYTLDLDDPLIAAPAQPRPTSVSHISQFDNGVPVPVAATKLYLSFESAEARARWPHFADTTAPDSFYAWLNSPADDDPLRGTSLPVITNLGSWFYRLRPDVAAVYTDRFQSQRIQYVIWLLSNAGKEHNLDPAFIEPIRDSFLQWANSPVADDPQHDAGLPVVTNFALYTYRNSPALRKKYPDLYGKHRVDFLIWFVQQPRLIEADVGDFARPIIGSWARACSDGSAPKGLEPAAKVTPRWSLFKR
jgi:hypothetical protein